MRSQEAQVATHGIDECLAVVGKVLWAYLLQLSATLLDAETTKGFDERVTEMSKV